MKKGINEMAGYKSSFYVLHDMKEQILKDNSGLFYKSFVAFS